MKHRGEIWTDEELAELHTLYKRGIKIVEISSILNRSESAISKKIKELYTPNRRVNWSEKEIEKLKELYNQRKSYTEIADILGKTPRACQGKAVRLGLKTKDCNVWKDKKRTDFWCEDEIEKLQEFVDKGFSADKIAEKLERSKKSVFYKMGVLNLSIKEKTDFEKSNYRRAYTVDDDYFEDINTQKKAYFLGWLITDGYIISKLNTARNGEIKSNKIGLKLEKSDLDVIEDFKHELKTNTPVKYSKARISKEYTNKNTGKTIVIYSKEQCCLEVTSAKMITDLKQYGIYQGKTYTVTFPKKLKEDFYSGFIAGVLSGDGSVDVKKNHKTGHLLRSSVCGTYDLISNIKTILVKNIGFNSEKAIMQAKDSKSLYILELNQTETIKLYYWLKDNNIFLMSRKNKIIEDFIKMKPDIIERIMTKGAL